MLPSRLGWLPGARTSWERSPAATGAGAALSRSCALLQGWWSSAVPKGKPSHVTKGLQVD